MQKDGWRQEQKEAQAAERAAEKERKREERKLAVKARAAVLTAEGASAISSPRKVPHRQQPSRDLLARTQLLHGAAQRALQGAEGSSSYHGNDREWRMVLPGNCCVLLACLECWVHCRPV